MPCIVGTNFSHQRFRWCSVFLLALLNPPSPTQSCCCYGTRRSTTPSRSSTRFPKSPTKTPPSSCSCCATTLPCGHPTRERQKRPSETRTGPSLKTSEKNNPFFFLVESSRAYCAYLVGAGKTTKKKTHPISLLFVLCYPMPFSSAWLV